MKMILNLLRQLGSGQRASTPTEVRDLIRAGQLAAAAASVERLAPGTPQRELVRLGLAGEIAFRRHDDEKAERDFRAALAIAPGDGNAHYGLSLLLLAQGEPQRALRHAQFAVNDGASDPRFNAQLGLCQLELGNYALAETALLRATRVDPTDKSSWNNLGIAKRAGGDLLGARPCFQRAIELDAGFAKAIDNAHQLELDIEAAGLSMAEQEDTPAAVDGDAASAADEQLEAIRQAAREGRMDEAVDLCEVLCANRPDDAVAAIELYRLYRDSGDLRSGFDALEAFRSRHPDEIDVVAQLGLGYLKVKDFKAAKPLLERAISARPDDVPLLLGMAEVRDEQGRLAEAGELLERARTLEDSLMVQGKLAASLVARCRYEEAVKLIEAMLERDPDTADDVSSIYVYALTYLGRHDEALPMLDRAIARYPNNANIRFPRATIHLQNERFAQGWDDYAHRALGSTVHLRMLPFPEWQGEPIEGKTIVVLAEQGLGDQVMFASCLPDLLAARPARVIVEAVDRVAPTLARSFPQCEVRASKQDRGFEWVKDIGHVDYFVAIGDLPRLYRRSLEDFPHHQGYLRADPARIRHWRDQLAALGPQPKIGLTWRGGIELTRKGMRSLDVTALQPFATACDADWICLQYGEVADDLERARAAGLPMHYWPESIKDLDDFSALICALDLVVTVCNTTVHYAGALNQPVWVMAPKVPEWRYGLKLDTMPWYPSARVYRQTEAGNWNGLLERVQGDLNAFGEAFKRAPPHTN